MAVKLKLKKNIIIIGLSCFLAILFTFYCLGLNDFLNSEKNLNDQVNEKTGNSKMYKNIFHQKISVQDPIIIPVRDTFYQEYLFSQDSALQFNNLKTYDENHIVGLIMPHHILASELMHRSMSLVQNTHYDQIIIIGPNHKNLGINSMYIPDDNVVYQMFDNNTVKINHDLYKKFSAIKNLGVNSEIFQHEHSIGAIVPFIYKYFGEKEILPITLASFTKKADINKLVDILVKEIKSTPTLIIFSIDFSHYLKQQQADIRDRATLRLIEQYNYDSISSLNSDYLDSPATLILALQLQERLQLQRDVIYHFNSNDFLQIPTNETTSYFGFVFY